MLLFVASRSLFTPVTSPFSLFMSSAFALVASSAFTEVARLVTFWSTAVVAFLFCLRAAISWPASPWLVSIVRRSGPDSGRSSLLPSREAKCRPTPLLLIQPNGVPQLCSCWLYLEIRSYTSILLLAFRPVPWKGASAPPNGPFREPVLLNHLQSTE